MKSVAVILLAALVLGCASALHYDKSGNALEPASSTPYPLKLAGGMELAGVAIRVKKIVFVSVQVYAVGLYVDTQEVGKEMAAFAGKPSAELISSGSKVYGELLKDSAMTKTLRLVMVRTVTGAQMGSAISEAVEARMTDKSKQGAEAFEALKQTFSMPELKTGTEITFTWTQGGNLAVKLEGKDIGEMHSVSLATALFDVFLGETAVVERGALVENLADLISR